MMCIPMKWTINGLTDIHRVAKEFLDFAGDKKIFALYGPMGVGKTTFVKAVAACEGVVDDVSSPTFAIVNEYQTAQGKAMYHFDFYRVKMQWKPWISGMKSIFSGAIGVLLNGRKRWKS